MIQKKPVNSDNTQKADNTSCLVCQGLLIHLEQFFNILNTARRSTASDWLTVDDIAKELKVSKSIVYRLIRHGELEAVDIVETNGEVAKKGHYRVKRSKLNKYLERKKVKPLPDTSTYITRSRCIPKVKNHLGL